MTKISKTLKLNDKQTYHTFYKVAVPLHYQLQLKDTILEIPIPIWPKQNDYKRDDYEGYSGEI